ncbi:ADP-ribosylation factor-like protein 5B isoform X2 [Varanus komodoensis]|uniref:ADP-ribosylation factor-like protein 5B isoform X2 n=1 Tax=Varanus komodoensis TaxID=61221 RepID=UPI001CF7E884|nr:ADP-ribosylation factor-like protein 5B isoform X2 [Varanus komodoensis]
MGLIFAKLWSFFCNQEHKVIIVGLDNAGKTTILYQFLMNEVVHTSPTIGSNVEEIVVKNTHFLMWDIGGQESLRSSWNTYYSNTEFIILVVDSIDRERLTLTREELYRMLAHEVHWIMLLHQKLGWRSYLLEMQLESVLLMQQSHFVNCMQSSSFRAQSYAYLDRKKSPTVPSIPEHGWVGMVGSYWSFFCLNLHSVAIRLFAFSMSMYVQMNYDHKS